jgi:transglutaminase-like putative cysteine protease
MVPAKGLLMPQRPSLYFSLLCLTLPATAQAASVKPLPVFDISAAALLKSSPNAAAFPDAASITLRDESITELHADGTSVDVTHETFKIFNQRAHDKAEISIPYNASNEKITNVHARTIKPDGTVLTAGAGDIHQSAPFSEYAMYDDAKINGISMPGVEDGAIIDYTYTRTTTKSYLPGQYSEQWTFRDGVAPVKVSKMTLTAPASMKLQTLPRNTSGMTATETLSKDGTHKTYVWKMSNLASLLPEPMMPPTSTFIPSVEISTIPSWQVISRWYQNLASGQMAVSPEIKDTVKTLTAGKTTDTEKAKAIYYWVEGRTRYVALELGLSAFQPHPAADVCRNRYGDCKDMATLLLTMLHEAGIKTAWPVLLGAGRVEPVHNYLAAPSFFNHAIVRADIDGKPYWFDSTAEMCPFGQIPGGDRGVDAFVIRDGNGSFEVIPVGTPQDNRETTITRVDLHADGSADCETTIRLDGDSGLGTRISFRGLQEAQVKPGFQSMVSHFSPNATLSDYKLSPLADRDQPVVFDLKYHAPLWATKTGHLLIMDGKDMTSAPFDRADRTFPIYERQTQQAEDDIVVTLPDGYTLEDKPDEMHEKTPLGDYEQTISLTGNTLTIHLIATSHPGQIAPGDYAAAKAQHEKIVTLRKQPIVLRLLDKSAAT